MVDISGHFRRLSDFYRIFWQIHTQIYLSTGREKFQSEHQPEFTLVWIAAVLSSRQLIDMKLFPPAALDHLRPTDVPEEGCCSGAKKQLSGIYNDASKLKRKKSHRQNSSIRLDNNCLADGVFIHASMPLTWDGAYANEWLPARRASFSRQF